jgi:hypothetical protein
MEIIKKNQEGIRRIEKLMTNAQNNIDSRNLMQTAMKAKTTNMAKSYKSTLPAIGSGRLRRISVLGQTVNDLITNMSQELQTIRDKKDRSPLNMSNKIGLKNTNKHGHL